ncbi:MAG: tetratricopeptide repeat protein [Candidatus Omnitrophica bacterium]|nr:tetratricopeptide repeat protein [Candidatus Omnitrophota bacterium]
MKILKTKNKLLYCLLSLLFIFGSFALPGLAQNNEEELFLVAQKAFEDGFYDVTIRYVDQLTEQFPQSTKLIQAKLLLGQCYFFKNQYLKAYEIFNGLLQYPELKDATLFWLGETYLKGGDYPKAEEQYKQIIQLFPDSVYFPQAFYSLGWVYFDKGDFVKAKEVFKKLVTQFPSNQLAEDSFYKIGECEYNSQNYKEAIDNFQVYIKLYPDTTRMAECFFYIAESHYYLGDPLTAVTFYAKAGDKSLDHKLALMAKVSMGWSYLKLAKYKISQEAFEGALAFAQEKGILTDDVYLGLANLYSETKEYNKALESFQNLISNFPNSRRMAEAMLGKANIHFLLNEYKDAIVVYAELISKYSSDKNNAALVEKAYFGLAWSYLKDGKVDLSIKTFNEIKNKAENKTVKMSALAQIGDAYQDIGEWNKAIEIYDQVLKDYPESIYADYLQYQQGIALLKTGNLDSATLSFQALQSNFPESKYLNDVKYYLAVAYFKKGDWTSAKNQIKPFIEGLEGESEFLSEGYYILALSNFNLDNYKEAAENFRIIIDKFPDQSSLLKNSDLGIAKCLYKSGNVKDALKHFRMLLFKYPESSTAQEALIWLGDHYLSIADFDNAINYYQQYVNNYPGGEKIDEVYFELGEAYQAKKEFDKAIAAYKRIKEGNKNIYAQGKLSIAEIMSQAFDPQEAIKTYEDIILSSPELKKDIYLKIGLVYKKQNDNENAIKAFYEALKSPPGESKITDAEIQFNIGDILEMSEKPDNALEEYLKIPYLYKKDIEWVIKAYLRAAQIFEDQDKWENAKEAYNKIIESKTEEAAYAEERLSWIKENIKE